MGGVWEGEGVVLGQGVFNDFTPGYGVVEWAHSRIHHTFILLVKLVIDNLMADRAVSW